jgi:hypothetical protein
MGDCLEIGGAGGEAVDARLLFERGGRVAWIVKLRHQQPGGEFPPTDATTRADHEAFQVAAAGATVSFHP